MAMYRSDIERSARSVFVGNIPYDATEEHLKDIFTEVGPVVSFRLVFDRETGKAKGYGFCEYRDVETANSAMRNLNGYELGNRPLRVDSAANERAREEYRNLQPQPVPTRESYEASSYGPDVDPGQAPETISKAVAALPPEQMFELAKQMKQCIQTNPNEARNMLLQNPQLSYALLQALVIMKVLDPEAACSILYRQNEPANLRPFDAPAVPPGVAQHFGNVLPPVAPPQHGPAGWASSGPGVASHTQHADPRIVDPRVRDGPKWERENQMHQAFDPRASQLQAQNQPTVADPRLARNNAPPAIAVNAPSNDPRLARGPAIDPRLASRGNAQTNSTPSAPGPSSGVPPVDRSVVEDQEKAALIMQVLSLSEAQIAALPPDQQDSVRMLRQQLAQQT